MEPSDSESDCSGCSDCESDSDAYAYDLDAPLCMTAAHIRGGAERRLKRSRRLAAAWQGGKKKKKKCNRYGNAQAKHHDIHSGVIEGPEGPFVPEGQEDSELRNDMQEGGGSERGGSPMAGGGGDTVDELGGDSNPGEGEGSRGKGKSVKGKGCRQRKNTKRKARITLSAAAEWERVLKAATTPMATPLLARLCMMSSRDHQNALCQLVKDPSQPHSVQPPGEVQLVNIVTNIEGAACSTKVTELLRMLVVMNLALQLDQ